MSPAGQGRQGYRQGRVGWGLWDRAGIHLCPLVTGNRPVSIWVWGLCYLKGMAEVKAGLKVDLGKVEFRGSGVSSHRLRWGGPSSAVLRS